MTPNLHAILVLLHLLSAILWIGGMAFAHYVFRPTVAQMLEPPQRLPLIAAVLGRFFRIVAVAVVVLLATGITLLVQVGMANAPIGWHIMLTLGLVMTAIFGFINHGLFPKLRRHVADKAWPAAAAVQNRIRVLVYTNLWLGLLTVAAAVSARY
ncbi:MAG: CopD family protein [Hydrogenophaga sp.]|uniref:DUF4149 domain-containing protein n=1 Tax=Hydrogenophaga sp. TaxID=1904254 RepID=UPI001DDA6558|nr:DUF4149 domain-containing protein [Hydrogenophaga sp.]MBX3610879.1 CopD family protein [Hydrogenophaga sp.]